MFKRYWIVNPHDVIAAVEKAEAARQHDLTALVACRQGGKISPDSERFCSESAKVQQTGALAAPESAPETLPN